MSDIQQIPFAEYVTLDALNASTLKAFRDSALAGAAYCEKGLRTTAAMRLGRALHEYMDDEAAFRDNAVTVKGLRPGSGVEKFEAAEAEHPDRIVLAETWADDIAGMVASIKRHPKASKLLALPTEREATVVWDDPDIGVRCKMRIDRLYPGVGCVDWKTCSDFSKAGIGRAIANFAYHMQAAWYIRGMHIGLGIEQPDFGFVFVDSSYPYEVAVVDLPPETIEQGWAECLIAADRWKKWTATGHAPCRCEGVMTVGLPGWAQEPYAPSVPLLREESNA